MSNPDETNATTFDNLALNSVKRWRVPLWPVALFLVVALLAWDWVPYLRVMRIHRELVSKCKSGTPDAWFAEEVKTRGLTVQYDYDGARGSINLLSLGVPRTVRTMSKLAEWLNLFSTWAKVMVPLGANYHLEYLVDSRGFIR